MFAPKVLYPNGKPYDLSIFDLRIPGAIESYWSERVAWAEAGDIEMLDEDHIVLIVRPGSARRLAA